MTEMFTPIPITRTSSPNNSSPKSAADLIYLYNIIKLWTD